MRFTEEQKKSCISTNFRRTSTNSFGSTFLTTYVCCVQMNDTPAMKRVIYIAVIAVFAVSATSCQTTSATQKANSELAGYTLKNKKELFQQKVLNKKPRTVIVTP